MAWGGRGSQDTLSRGLVAMGHLIKTSWPSLHSPLSQPLQSSCPSEIFPGAGGLQMAENLTALYSKRKQNGPLKDPPKAVAALPVPCPPSAQLCCVPMPSSSCASCGHAPPPWPSRRRALWSTSGGSHLQDRSGPLPQFGRPSGHFVCPHALRPCHQLGGPGLLTMGLVQCPDQSFPRPPALVAVAPPVCTVALSTSPWHSIQAGEGLCISW